MSWYEGKHSCGHEGGIELVGTKSYKEWRAKQYFSDLCPDCKQKENEERNKEIAEQYDMPDLSGTEKQIVWANTIRADFLDYCEKHELAAEFLINTKTDAKFWIDNRDHICDKEFVLCYEDILERKLQASRFLPEDTIIPTSQKYHDTVEITEYVDLGGVDRYIKLCYTKNSEFINLVKSEGYEWNQYIGGWCKSLPKIVKHDFENEAIEIGKILLDNGFSICVHDENIKAKLELIRE